MQTVSEPEPIAAVSSRFWPGFLLGFFLLFLLSCGGLFMVSGLSRLSLADLQSNGPAWVPPPAPPTPDPALQPVAAAAQAAESGLSQGLAVRNITNSRVNVRRTPGYQGKPDTDIILLLQPGDRMVILDGPEPADGLVWWLIRSNTGSRAVEGWVAEATASGVTILGP